MSEFSDITAMRTGPDADQSTNQMHEPIRAFLDWLDRTEVQNKLESPSHVQGERQRTRFTNGPYAEIKESIDQFILKEHR